MKNITHFSLPNGIPLAHIHVPTAAAEYLAVIVDAGSRDENRRQHGLAHFVEHTIFKGTPSRSSIEILNEMETLGGELNAYTTKEETMIYTVSPRGHVRTSASLLSDLIANASFPTREVEKERQIVADELESYLDIPSEAIFDDFEDLIFKGTPLGHNILGTKKSVESLDSRACKQWLDDFFVPSAMGVVYLGSAEPCQVHDILSSTLGEIPERKRARRRELNGIPTSQFSKTRRIGSHQAHVMLGLGSASFYSEERHAWSLMANVLGGPGMNSLLNIAMREQHGLVYNVEAANTCFVDGGIFTIYFGCDKEDVNACLEVCRKVIHDFAKCPLRGERLEAALRQYTGQMTVATESHLETALGAARRLLRYGEAGTLEGMIAKINSISARKIEECAVRLDSEAMNMLIMR